MRYIAILLACNNGEDYLEDPDDIEEYDDADNAEQVICLWQNR